MISFLHAADLHLGWRTTRFDERARSRIGEARFEALEKLRALAAERQAQFMLLAGDVFDDHSVSKGISERAFTLFEGKSMPCPVYIIAGNHDPLTPGGVWDREPWTREQPVKHTFLLRKPELVRVPGVPVTLFPCPLRNRNSIDDPTAWIATHPRSPEDQTIRIGLAHGSLRMLPNLPEDDHLIRADAAAYYGLDYLALGHWHKPLLYGDRGGSNRIAYSGTHEPMRFPASPLNLSTGWTSYSSDGDSERFHDDGRGTAQFVTIDAPGASPRIETIEVGRLRWSAEAIDLTSSTLGPIISKYAERSDRDRTILHLRLSGVVNSEQYQRAETVLREIVENRYYLGSRLDYDDLLIEPDQEEVAHIAGDGVIGRMLKRLAEEIQTPDPSKKRLAEHARKVLYRIAWELQSS
jgi:DNA repair exonuclease SbcCD nuclease subunit